MDIRPNADSNQGAVQLRGERNPQWVNAIGLLVWLAAGAVAFLPFAFDTSPWDAVTLRVPGNQGNWWHFLAGAPCFLAFPMIWLRLHLLLAKRGLTMPVSRLIWLVVALSICGTTLVEVPFLLHLAGTSDWQRFAVLGLGFGIIVASVLVLILRRRHFVPEQACIAGIDAAFLANMALVLVVYAGAPGGFASRSGWVVSIVIVWPIACELLWLLGRSFRTEALWTTPRGE